MWKYYVKVCCIYSVKVVIIIFVQYINKHIYHNTFA